MASAAMPGHRIYRRCRLSREWNRWAGGWGTLMRHFLLFGSIPALAFGVGMTTSPAGLIAATGGPDGSASCLRRTALGAVAVAAITVAANDHGLAAAGAEVASSCRIHGQRPMGGRQQRPLREILCLQRCPSGQRGATAELAWRLGPLSRRHLHRRRCFTVSAESALPTRPIPPCPSLPHCVCQTAVCSANRPPEALRAAG